MFMYCRVFLRRPVICPLQSQLDTVLRPTPPQPLLHNSHSSPRQPPTVRALFYSFCLCLLDLCRRWVQLQEVLSHHRNITGKLQTFFLITQEPYLHFYFLKTTKCWLHSVRPVIFFAWASFGNGEKSNSDILVYELSVQQS